ncbi:DUF72 domain-containing protein [Actinoplanes teichomyceticus]|uniref:Uncharacterized protein YecE (DUF72 family) n=1 Tax=Actinoplanes teichomyceticus TaxID=1867 RepID=A0A561W9P4_ACTTI|nr:DUF72 domain-containing protein [Actinoplanes teichomyceticus]TWG20596.1 uncharacterized protein YecE (DUF72 family) [Actinoplanes teichomyceticus]GIF15932.1 hypothetical protein Ate01nite_59640 [Actinoplanes teichomyceticus]
MLWIGTSGWQYRDWRPTGGDDTGFLYPAGLPQRLWLEHYAERFATVEVNNAFYRLPERDTFAAWRERTPDGFVVAVKMSRYLTHIKRLREPAEPVARFLDRAQGLGDKLGPVLLQLPPTLRADLPALEETLARFPAWVRVAVEPRHPTWFTAECEQLLRRHGAALCWADRKSRPITPLWRTADFGYLRFHEGTARPWPRYGRSALRSWLDRMYPPATHSHAEVPTGAEGPTGAEAPPGGHGTAPAPALTDVVAARTDRRGAHDARPEGGGVREWFVFFNNDPGGAAVIDAGALAGMAARRGLPVTRAPRVPPRPAVCR